MFSTEKYEIIFTGVKDKNFNIEVVVNNWREAAEIVNEETGLYINAQYTERVIVCNHCCALERAIVATVIRNPISESNAGFFYEVMQQVVNITKKLSGNVPTTTVKNNVEVSIR